VSVGEHPVTLLGEAVKQVRAQAVTRSREIRYSIQAESVLQERRTRIALPAPKESRRGGGGKGSGENDDDGGETHGVQRVREGA
jgi:hypothetical protein